MLARACVQYLPQTRSVKGILAVIPSDIAFLTSHQTDHSMHDEVAGRPRTSCGCNLLMIINRLSPSLGTSQTSTSQLGLH